MKKDLKKKEKRSITENCINIYKKNEKSYSKVLNKCKKD